MSPFGKIYGLDVFVAESLAEDGEIAFNACGHTKLIKINFVILNGLSLIIFFKLKS